MAQNRQPVPQWAMPFLGDQEKLDELGLRFNPIWLKWFLDFYDAVATGGAVDHNLTSSLQGGAVDQYYHLSLAAHTLLTSAQAANRVLAGPTSGVAAVPTFRALSLASADFANQGTTTTLLHGNASGNPSWGAVALATDVTGTLPATNGGTAQATYAAGDLLYASAINVLSKLAVGSAGKMLRSSGLLPGWSTSTWPDTITANQVLYATGTDALGGSTGLTFSGTDLTVSGKGVFGGYVSTAKAESDTINSGNAPVVFVDGYCWLRQGTIHDINLDVYNSGALSNALKITQTAQVQFTNIGTTASAANAFLDSGAGNNLLRSTSSMRYKTNPTPIGEEEARSTVLKLAAHAMSYQSLAAEDDKFARHLGFGAENVYPIDPRLTTLRNGLPESVQYERIPVLQTVLLADHEYRLQSLEHRR